MEEISRFGRQARCDGRCNRKSDAFSQGSKAEWVDQGSKEELGLSGSGTASPKHGVWNQCPVSGTCSSGMKSKPLFPRKSWMEADSEGMSEIKVSFYYNCGNCST